MAEAIAHLAAFRHSLWQTPVSLAGYAGEAKKIHAWLTTHDLKRLRQEPLSTRRSVVSELALLQESLNDLADLTVISRYFKLAPERLREVFAKGSGCSAEDKPWSLALHRLLMSEGFKARRFEQIKLEAPDIENCLAALKSTRESLFLRSRL